MLQCNEDEAQKGIVILSTLVREKRGSIPILVHGRFSDEHCYPISSARLHDNRQIFVRSSWTLYHPHRRLPPSSPALSMVLLLAAVPRGAAGGGSIAQPLWYIVNSIGGFYVLLEYSASAHVHPLLLCFTNLGLKSIVCLPRSLDYWCFISEN